MSRRSHLVGTIPGSNAREAMELALSQLGDTLGMLGDGETGPRAHWVQPSINALRAHPDLELVREGAWSDYDDTPRYRIKRGHRLRGATLDFGYLRHFRESFPAFQQLTAARGLVDLPFLVGIPGPFDMAVFSLGPKAGFLHRRPFTSATVRDVAQIHAEAPGRVVFQIEVPAELVLMARAPSAAHPALGRHLGGVVAEVAREAPAGTRWGIHLCLGDMNHRALATMRDTRPLVALANAIARRWPQGRSLDFVHAPFAAALEPPPTDPRWYQPLERLRLPPGTSLIAGFAHEDQDLARQLEIRAIIDGAVGSPVDVACSCGLGRRDQVAAAAAMRRTAELAAAD